MPFVRIGEFRVRAEAIEDVRDVYEIEAIPVIRSAAGNISAVLLQQHESRDAFMAITIWKTRADAEAYESSGAARAMVDKVRFGFAGPPVLTTYDAYGIGATA
jgi:quinol monooxygenase YgiN